jgi:hypothetical protein
VFNQPIQASNSDGEIKVEVYAENPGTYLINAQDITYDDIIIEILDTDTLYVTPINPPSLIEEPEYTKGITNTLFWNSIGSGYKYNIQVSESNTFSTIKDSSGWISGTMYEFNNLDNGIMYFYRVKARNAYGGESNWSNIRYSVQDNEAPVIILMSVSSIGDNNNVEWESGYEIQIIYRVTDNLSLDNSELFCIKQDGSKYSCGDIEVNGVLYTATIPLSDLERDGINNLFLTYTFCVEATDSAGNRSENCDFKLEIPKWEGDGDEEEPPQEVPTSIGRIIRDIIDNTDIIMDDMFGNLTQFQLQDISTTTTIATITIGFGSLFGGLIYIPIYFFQFVLSLLSWFGLRKRGQLSGYVYDSNTKEPIAQAVIRVYSSEGSLVWTDVTDSRGLFGLGLNNGEYTLKVTARGYKFPSKIIFGKSDYPLENVYHGEKFRVIENVIPEFSIPIDSVELSWFNKLFAVLRGRLRVFYKILSLILFVFGLVFSLYTYSVNSNWFNFILILFYIPSFILIVRVIFKKTLEYGVVKDENGKPLSGIAVGLRDVEYGRIVSKRNTDGKGRYRFIVDKGDYTLEILDTEYEVVKIEEEKPRKLSDGSVLIALDTVIKPIEVEK